MTKLNITKEEKIKLLEDRITITTIGNSGGTGIKWAETQTVDPRKLAEILLTLMEGDEK